MFRVIIFIEYCSCPVIKHYFLNLLSFELIEIEALNKKKNQIQITFCEKKKAKKSCKTGPQLCDDLNRNFRIKSVRRINVVIRMRVKKSIECECCVSCYLIVSFLLKKLQF